MYIKELKIESFRGLPGVLTVDFTKKSSTAKSMIIFGSNGTGKSSIVDAIEFVFRGTIGSQKLKTGIYPSALSLATSSSARVSINVDNGKVVSRSLERLEDGSIKSVNNSERGIIGMPFILRRSDILRFYDTSELDRQRIFFNYFVQKERQIQELPEEKKHYLDLELIQLRDIVNEKLLTLSRLLRYDVARLNIDEINSYITQNVFGGLDSKLRWKMEKNGKKIKSDKYSDEDVMHISTTMKELAEIYKRRKEIKTLRRTEIQKDSKKPARYSFLLTALENASKTLTDSFLQISAVDFVESIELKIGEESEISLSVAIFLKDGRRCEPRQVFSEANLDLLAVLIFLAIAEEANIENGLRLLVLDDVLQSVDSGFRVTIAEYILKRFKKWQIIFTVHDRLWYAQLQQLFSGQHIDVTCIELSRWKFVSGPSVIAQSQSTIQDFLDVTQRGNPLIGAAIAGQKLEEVAQHLSWEMAIEVPRNRYDQYTLGVLWPRIYKKLSKTSIASIVAEVNKWIHLRNLVSAHYNEWAQSAEISDISSFTESVVNLYAEVYCTKCLTWISQADSGTYKCRCGEKKITKTLQQL